MGCCSASCSLVLLCCLQLITALERQVFDFLGYQWAPIVINFLHVLVLVLGLFGVIQCRLGHVVLYLLWSLLWVGWNVFVSCLYLDLGGLSKDSDVLSLGLSSHRSWWKDNAPRCDGGGGGGPPTSVWRKQENPELTTVASCWLEYQHIEILHCSVQIAMSLLGFVNACVVVSAFTEDDGFHFIGEFQHTSKVFL